MKTRDHLILGRYLINNCAVPQLKYHRKAFLLGCIEPDYNIFSYLRGMRRYKKFRGHNSENSFLFLMRCFDYFDGNKLNSSWDYFRLGAMIHYIADAFTAPHNGFWKEGILEHSAYESALHGSFKSMLESVCPEQIPYMEYAPLHRAYCAQTHDIKSDFRYILTACLSVMRKYVLRAEKTGKVCGASFNYNRPAQKLPAAQ